MTLFAKSPELRLFLPRAQSYDLDVTEPIVTTCVHVFSVFHHLYSFNSLPRFSHLLSLCHIFIMSIRSTFFFIPFRNCTYVRPGYSAGEQNLYPTASMPGGLRKRRKTVAREAVPLGTEEKPVPKTGGSVERFGWSVLLPSSGSGASSSLHMPPTSLRRVLVWEDTHEDHPHSTATCHVTSLVT